MANNKINKRIWDFPENTSPSKDNLFVIDNDFHTQKLKLGTLSKFFGDSSNLFFISSGVTTTIPMYGQKIIYGDLTINPGGIIDNFGELIIINGSLINNGGTYNSSGGTISLITTNSDTSRTVIIDNIASSGATIGIVTYTTKTFIRVLTPLTGDTFFTCSDTSNTNIGDTLTISTIIGFEQPWSGTSGSIELIFDSKFIAATCGEISYPISTIPVNAPRNIITFTFDGDYWLNTYDNC